MLPVLRTGPSMHGAEGIILSGHRNKGTTRAGQGKGMGPLGVKVLPPAWPCPKRCIFCRGTPATLVWKVLYPLDSVLPVTHFVISRITTPVQSASGHHRQEIWSTRYQHVTTSQDYKTDWHKHRLGICSQVCQSTNRINNLSQSAQVVGAEGER